MSKLVTNVGMSPTLARNIFFSLPLILVVSYFTGDIQKAIEYEGWGNPMFFVQFRFGYKKKSSNPSLQTFLQGRPKGLSLERRNASNFAKSRSLTNQIQASFYDNAIFC